VGSNHACKATAPHGGRVSLFGKSLCKAGALLTLLTLLIFALPAAAQTFPNLSGTWTGSRVQTSPPPGTPANSNQVMTLYQVSPGGNVVGTITTYWPGTNYTWTGYASGTISGSTLALTYTMIPSTEIPSGGGCSESLNLTLATSGGVTTATVPQFSCGGEGHVDQYTLTLVGWQKMYGLENAPCISCGPGPFADNAIDAATGNVVAPTTDYETAGPNKLSLIRYYNSYQTVARLPALATAYVVPNVPNVTTNYDLGLTINTARTQVTAYRGDGQQLLFNLLGTTWTPDTDVDMVLTGSGAGTWTLTDHDDTVETYTMTIPGGSPGYAQLNSIKSRNGYTRTIAYNGSNQVSTVTDSYNRKLTFSYTSGYLTQVTTPDSLVLSYGYSSSGVHPGVNDRISSVSYNTSPVTSQTYNYTDSSFPFAVTSIVDENGNTYRSWTYDSYGRALTDQIGTGANANVTTITYNDTAGTRTEQNALGQKVTYTVASLQGANKVMLMTRTATSTVPAASSNFVYDNNGFVGTAVDWNGNTTAYTNNAHGDPTTVVEAQGTGIARTTTIAYDPTWVHLPDTITTTGLTTGFTYDGSGNPLTQTLTDTTTQSIPYSTNGQTRTTHFTWNNFLPQTVQTPNGNTTTFTFGADGALTNVQNALLQNTQITSHTGGGLPLTIVDPNSVTTTLTYSQRNWLLTSTVATSAGNLTTQNTYDAAGNLTQVKQPDGSYLNNAYDTAHRLTTVTDSFGNSIDYTLDGLGDRTVSNIENPSSVVTRGHTATYDTLGRLYTDVGGMSQSTAYTYDNNSNMKTAALPPGTTFTYAIDALNRWWTQSLTTGSYGSVTLSHDSHDRVLTSTDQAGNVTTYIYDGFGDAISQASPDTGTAVLYYDSDGNLTKKVDALSVTTNYTWDALDRVLTTTYPADASENVGYTYDQTGTGFSFGIGRLTSLTDAAGSLTRTYDERGNMLSEKRVSGTTTLLTSYTYDGASRVLTITYPGNALLTYTRDAMGRITAVSDKPSGASSATTLASSVTYEPFGPWAGLTYGNSITETPAWDLDYRLTSLTDTGTATVQHIGYTYATSDQPSAYTDSLTSSNSISSITYNLMFNLNGYTNGGAKSVSWGYNSNRSSQTGWTYTYTPHTNLLASFKIGSATTTVATNANGNITGFSPAFGTAGVTTLGYNKANRLSSVSGSGGTLGSYVYDAFSQRFSKTVGSATTLYQYSGGALLAEATGATETDYIYLDGRPLAMLTGTTFTWLHDDNLGRPQVATNASQTVVWKASYLPFGETIATSGTATVNLRSPGQYYDAESGFSHSGFRDYVPTLGRYLEADPLGIYDNAQRINAGMNPYNYVGADPMRSIDPWGLSDENSVCGKDKNNGVWCRRIRHPEARILVVTLPTGQQQCPQTVVKNSRQAKELGIPVGTTIPILVPPGADPQGDVSTWSLDGPFLPNSADFARFWWPHGPHDYKWTVNPIYDQYANWEYGATGAATGFSSSYLQTMADLAHVQTVSDLLHGGQNDPINTEDISAGFDAITNGDTLSTEQCTSDQ
jgi:RHS repeat-associated protein